MKAVNQAEWQALVGLLPENLDEIAKETGALVRKRHIKDGQTLLRLLMVYCLAGFSFRQTAAWAKESEVAQTSDVNLIERFGKCEAFLKTLLNEVLKSQMPFPQEFSSDRAVHLVDATNLGGWKLHLCWNACHFSLNQMIVADIRQAESLKHFTIEKGALMVLDRAYGTRKEIAYGVKEGADVVCRVRWNLPVEDAQGKRVNLLEEAKSGVIVVQEVSTLGQWDIPAVKGRVIIAPKPPEKLEKAKKRVRRNSSRRQVQIKPETEKASEYLFLFTTEMQMSPEELIALYRFRWQVELVFKRLKGLQQMEDRMEVKSPELCKVYILCHCLMAVLVERIIQVSGRIFPPQAIRETINMAIVSVYCPDTQGSLDRSELEKSA